MSGRDTDAPQLVDRVLRRLGLELAGVADVGHQRQVDEHAAPTPGVDRELPDRLQERQRLDVAHGPADLGDHEVDVGGVGHQPDPLLDLVGDVRHHLHGGAEVVAAPLAADHGVVDAAGGDVRGAAGVGAGEPLVVAEVEVGLRAVLGHEHLAVLVWRHRARVDVDVRVELLQLHVEPARHQQPPDRGGGDALAKRGDDPAGYEDESSLAWGHRSDSESSRAEQSLKVARRADASVPNVPLGGGLQQLAGVLLGRPVALAGAQHPHQLADDRVAAELGDRGRGRDRGGVLGDREMARPRAPRPEAGG